MNQIFDKDDFKETDTGEREEWMILADLKFNRNDETRQTCDCDTDTNIAKYQSFYTKQQTGEMPHWIDDKKTLQFRKQMQHQCQFKLVRWKTRSARCGKRAVWKMRGVENAVWKMRGVENA